MTKEAPKSRPGDTQPTKGNDEDTRPHRAPSWITTAGVSIAVIILLGILGWLYALQNLIHNKTDDVEKSLTAVIDREIGDLERKIDDVENTIVEDRRQLDRIGLKVETLEKAMTRMEGKLDDALDKSHTHEAHDLEPTPTARLD